MWVASVAPLAFGRLGKAQELAPLTESDSLARSLDYHSDAKTVDVHEYPEYEATQRCATCMYFQAGSGPVHGCKLMPGRSVSPGAWCKLWTVSS